MTAAAHFTKSRLYQTYSINRQDSTNTTFVWSILIFIQLFWDPANESIHSNAVPD